jgi:hypothetical protein
MGHLRKIRYIPNSLCNAAGKEIHDKHKDVISIPSVQAARLRAPLILQRLAFFSGQKQKFSGAFWLKVSGLRR